MKAVIQTEKQTQMAADIDITAERARYDECCKRLLSYKSILANILTSVTTEFRGMDPREAEKYIGKTTVSEEAVDPDTPDRIVGENGETSFDSEGTRYFDIKFRARAPKSPDSEIELLINVEAHNMTESMIIILKRGMYYCGRLLSAQYGTEFSESDFGKLKKVYSIWICLNGAKSRENSVIKYSVQPEALIGAYPQAETDRVGYDMLSMITINLGNTSKDMDGIIGLLGTLLMNNKANEKKFRLHNDFGIPMTKEFDEEELNMCNVSSYFEKKWKEEGREEGIFKTMKDLIVNNIMTPEKASEFFNMPLEKVKEICAEQN